MMAKPALVQQMGGPMSNQPHPHAKDCPDYKAAAADRAKRDAAVKEREARQQALAHDWWMGFVQSAAKAL